MRASLNAKYVLAVRKNLKTYGQQIAAAIAEGQSKQAVEITVAAVRAKGFLKHAIEHSSYIIYDKNNNPCYCVENNGRTERVIWELEG